MLKVKNVTDINQNLNAAVSQNTWRPQTSRSPHHITAFVTTKGRGRNDQRDKKRIKGGEKETLEWSPLRHSLPQNRNHVETELTYKDTTKGTWGANDLFSLLEACSNWRLTGGYDGWKLQYDTKLSELNWIMEIKPFKYAKKHQWNE